MLIRIILIAVWLAFTARVGGAEESSKAAARAKELSDLNAMAEPSSVTTQAAADANVALSGINVSSRTSPTYKITSDNRYVLYGNLFNTDKAYAVVQMESADDDIDSTRPGLAFLTLEGGRWKLLGLWNIAVTWRPKGWSAQEGDYLPAKPAEIPFQLQDLNGDRIPELLVAGGVEKYFQSWYILQFDPKDERLRLIASAMARPKLTDGYVLLYFDSGRRAIWGETEFYRWIDGKLVEVASWHNEVPYNGVDPEFDEFEVRETNGSYDVFHLEETTPSNRDVYTLQKNGKPWAVAAFKVKRQDGIDVDGEVELDWFFRELTGIPAKVKLFDKESSPPPMQGDSPSTLNPAKAVTVTGDADAIMRLSPK